MLVRLSNEVLSRIKNLVKSGNSLSHISPHYLDKDDQNNGRCLYLEVCNLYLNESKANIQYVNTQCLPTGVHDFMLLAKLAVSTSIGFLKYIKYEQVEKLNYRYLDIVKFAFEKRKEMLLSKDKKFDFNADKPFINASVNMDWLPNGVEDIKAIYGLERKVNKVGGLKNHG